MRVLNLESIAAAPAVDDPYRYFVGDAALKPEAVGPLIADFPDIRQPGFYPVTDMTVHGAFADLIADVNEPAFSRVMGEKLGLELESKPKLITIRKWSATSDGRIHTDSLSKIATTLIYLNEQWAGNGGGCLRVLRGPKDFEDYSAEISPVAGTIFGFRRAENSWHGHLPFAGERKVVQITWLIDDS
ncbi:MAG: 2OG-Fe(II) oxygenase, partial [Rhodospirillaceae bacterium]